MIPGQQPSGVGRKGGSRYSTGVMCAGVALGVGVGKNHLGSFFQGSAEDVALRKEGAEPDGGPGAEVASEELGSIFARKKGDLPRAALWKALHPKRGIHRKSPTAWARRCGCFERWNRAE